MLLCSSITSDTWMRITKYCYVYFFHSFLECYPGYMSGAFTRFNMEHVWYREEVHVQYY